ncbi:glycosyltransferase family 2 protein [Helicobacter sp. MIT 14-3879]|uniref:glycosyltransferase family 2 protein n=1 Tax=Helicobacter sp. MIT 14-3879 TaxID=2040649 RepID=UPI000E1F0853|nr:glycosyltransferase family 2 protein [Helicobacter sp. MIT 14-3879]RDU65544.1 glycosyltransferase [Helicobacter sp. MIT 14-3879]
MQTPTLYLVVPCYNESEIIKLSIETINKKLESLINKKAIKKKSKIIFVNDGSKDNTLDLLKQYKTKLIEIISLSTNKGHQNALLAGLNYAKDNCDIAISLDCDLQDDIDLIDKFVEKYKEGFEIVYGVRNNRKEDSFFKAYSAMAFYKIMKFLGVDIVYNHADYRLLSNRVLKCLLEFKEVNLFLRGIIPMLGFKSCKLYYKRNKRVAGESKYPFIKMLSFAIDGITSFSIKPLRILNLIGILISLFSLIIGIWALISYFIGNTISGWTSIVVPMYFLGGIQIIGLGIIGEYIGKIYKESKKRPLYFVDEIIK